MTDFIIHKQLQNDCINLSKLKLCHLLLMNNARAPWFILVPETDKTEVYELDKASQLQLLEEINLLSNFIKTQFNPDKLNIGAIGNIVRQLHIHIIGRNLSDICWPKVVWGNIENKPYTADEADKIRALARKKIKSLNIEE